MYNDNDDMFEVSDFDEDIQRREALINEAKEIPEESQWNEVASKINDLKRRWRQIPYWESAFEDKLAEEFDSILDVFYAKRKEGLAKIKELKEDLIRQAEEAGVSENLNKASEKMNALMEQWKEAGSAGKDVDDALWERFNGARQKFFDRKHQYWEDLQDKFENARKVKTNLIEEAEAFKDSEDWQKTSDKFKEMMDKWKSVGSAGKEFEDQLWNDFNEKRQAFYERRNAYYDSLHEKQDACYALKQKLVEEAKAIADANEYTRDHTAKMKQLGVDWKAIGSCGRDRENKIWEEFRGVMDSYFEGLKNWNEQRHAQWKQKMLDARNRKMDLLQKQKRQVQHMQEEIIGLIGERAIQEMEANIEDKKAFIAELEAELADIDKTLENQ